MVKGERRKKREEIRRIVAEDEKRRKAKEQKKDKPRSTNYRKDKEGNIILFGNIRFSKLSIGVLLGIVGIGVFFYFMSMGVGEMDGYVEPEFSFEACQEDGFTNDMCKFYYKFCREYADGTSICEFAEEDPWINYDRDENRWTEEEQDFLPPSEFIMLPFIQYAEARGSDEPSCYSTACKEDHPDLNDDKGETSKDVVTAKADVEKIKFKMTTLTDEINQWEVDRMEWKRDLKQAERDMEDAEDEYKEAKKEYRHATDIKPQNTDDIAMQKDTQERFKDATTKLKATQKAFIVEQNRYDKRMDDLQTAKNNLIYAQDELEEALDDLVISKVDANQSAGQQGDNKFINIVLSKSCLTLIENNMTTNCPTYRELRDVWDNTMPRVSGEWTELGYDVKREAPKYQNYWKYYEQLPSWKIITVDPDVEMMQRGITITIQATDFTYLENIKSSDKTPSYNSTGFERYEWHNVKYFDHCKSVLMAPDLELLPDIINNLWEGCTSQEPTVIELFFDEFDTDNSPWYVYQNWLNNALHRCVTLC